MTRAIWARLLEGETWVRRFGDFRTKERFGLVKRPNYVYGMLRAADVAKYFGKKATTVIEFGVASGAGLLNMVQAAAVISQETGIDFRIVGFDTGKGLPNVDGFRDHPELWRTGDFATQDREALLKSIDGRAEIIWGDIAETVDRFTERLDPSAPLGFVSIDVDIYTATKAALRSLTAKPELYNPALSLYFDDVTFFFANHWAGELAAIREFNDQHEMRKIDIDRSLPGRRAKAFENWYRNMYVCHFLDHEARTRPGKRVELTIGAHNDLMRSSFLY